MPSPTAVRSIVLVGTLLSAGLFVGTWFHNATAVGDSWLRRFAQCWSSTSSTATTDIQANLLQVQAYDACVASAQTTLAFFAVGGVAVAALLGLVVALAVPRVLERRRRLRADGGAVAIATPRLRELATDLGMRRMPRVAVGPSTVRDAFTYGRPGRYSVVLPTGVAIRPGDASTFDPLVRHELAHIRRRDVVLAWGARSFWLALLPILVAPVVWATATSDLSLLPVYVWRAAVLVAVTGLAAPAILRGREFEADLASSDTPEHREALAALLERLRERELPWWRAPLANHPDPADRRAAIADPSRITRLTVLDGLTVAFLAALVEPLLASLAWTVPSVGEIGTVVSMLLVGSVLGATLGVGLWRRSIVCWVAAAGAGRTESIRPDALRIALGTFAGYALGGAASLAQVGASTVTGLYQPWVVLLPALAVAGAVVVVASLGELATGIATLVGRRTYAVLCVFVSSLVFVVVLWAATTLARTVDLGGWILGAQTLVLVLVSWPVASTAVFLMMLVVVLTVAGSRLGPGSAAAPHWVVEESDGPAGPPTGTAVHPATPETATAFGRARPQAPRWLGPVSTKDLRAAALAGAVIGSVAAGSIWLYGEVSGPSTDPPIQEQRFIMYLWVYAMAALGATVLCRLMWGLVGVALGLVSGVVASTVAALGFALVVNPSRGGAIYLDFVEGNVRPAVALGLLFSMFASSFLVLGRPAPPAPNLVRPPGEARRRALAVGVLAVLLGAGLAQSVFAARDLVAPRWNEAAVLATLRERLEDVGVTWQGTFGSDAEKASYLLDFAPDVARRLLSIHRAMADVDSSAAALDVRGARVRTDVIAPLEQVHDVVRRQTVTDAGLAATHQHLASSVSESLGGAADVADGLENRDLSLYRRGATRWVAAQQEFSEWLDGLTTLAPQPARD
jgi:Zn-dependent protease with chaperone function